MNDKELHLWHWTTTDPLTGRRRQARHRMIEEQAREQYGADAQKVPGSLAVRQPNQGTNFLPPPK